MTARGRSTQGASRTDLRTGAGYAGGQTLLVDAPLESIQVFAHDGALTESIGRL